MKQSLSRIRADFESSCGETEEFRAFFNTFKREFTKELKSIGATNIQFTKGHFYVSGFYTIGTQAWYFSVSDVRGMPHIQDVNGYPLMYRKCKDYKDYTGERNQWVQIKTGMAMEMAR